jgi:cell pole-organizing protein PopZ
MEEIIASISRLIAEDKDAGGAARPAPAERDDILQLTEAISEDGSIRRLTPAADRITAFATGSEAPKAPPATTARIEPEPPRTDPEIPRQPDHGHESILSAATSEAAAAAFAKLGAIPQESRGESGSPLRGPGRSLEEIVHDALRPLLKAWLDEHLPGIVERLVREEIARVVDEAGLR